MNMRTRRVRLVFFTVLLCCCVFSCGKKEEKTASFDFLESEFTIKQTHEQSYVLDARGKIRNSSPYDVRNVVVTGYCQSCVLEFTARAWFVSDTEKMPNQVARIGYLAAGATQDFRFDDVAFYFTHDKQPPDHIPERIQMAVESYEILER
jgi:hypothetical protein